MLRFFSRRRRNPTRAGSTLYVAERFEPRILLAAIASDQTVTGTIATAGQVNAYTFSASAGQSVYAAVAETVAASPLTVAIELRAPNNALVSSSSSPTGTAILASALTQTGTYTLNISGLNNTTGAYAATLALPGVAPEPGTDAGPIASGAYRPASITEGDLDVHTIQGTAGGSLLVSMGELETSGFDPIIEIFSPTGALLTGATSAAGTVILQQNLPATGTYYVVAGDQFSDETGNYGITIATFGGTPIEDDDSGPIDSGQRRTGAIDPGDFDIYTLSGTSGGNLLASLGDLDPASGFDPDLVLFSPGGAVLSNTANPVGTQALVSNLTANGTYYAVVLDQFSDEPGAYALSAATFPATQTVDVDSGPLASGVYRTGAIDVGDFDVYTISGSTGGNLLATIGDLDAGSGYDPQLFIFTPAGALLDTATGAAGTALLASNLPTTGTYYVAVLDQFGDETGTYGLTLGSFAGTQPTDADSGPATSGVYRTGSIAPGDFDVYTISANSSGSLFVSMGETVTSGFDPDFLVFSPSGALLGSSASAGGSHLLLQNLASTGTYYVVGLDQFADETGDYGLTIARFGGSQNVGSGDEGGAIASGEYRTGLVAPGDFDVYTISASAGNSIVAAEGEIAAGSGFDPEFLIFSPTGALLNDSPGSTGASAIVTNLAATGTYAVVALDQFGDEAGEYGLSVARFGGPQIITPGDEGGALVSGERRLGRILPGDFDSYTFDLAAGAGAYWTVGETVENDLAPRLIVLGPAGNVISNTSGPRGRDAALAGTGAATAGTYTAVVMDGVGGATGEYALTGVAVPAVQTTDADSGALTSGQVRAGSLPAGDADVYTFTATAGQALTFRLAETAGSTMEPAVTVYAPNGTIAGVNSGAASAQVAVTSATAGTYTVVVSDAGGDGSGAYSLALNTTTGADTFAPEALDAAYRFDDATPTLRLVFSEDVSASFQPDDFVLHSLTTNSNIDPADLAISFTAIAHEIYFGFNPLPGAILPDGNYRLTIPAAKLTDAAGNPLPQDIVLDFFVLAGDANRDRHVDFNDLVALAQNYNAVGRTFSRGDFSYDGRVDFADLVLLAQRYNTFLQPPPAAANSVIRDESPAPVFSTKPLIKPTRKPEIHPLAKRR
jgi:hypothetical protein